LIKGTAELASEVLGMPVKIGIPDRVQRRAHEGDREPGLLDGGGLGLSRHEVRRATGGAGTASAAKKHRPVSNFAEKVKECV